MLLVHVKDFICTEPDVRLSIGDWEGDDRNRFLKVCHLFKLQIINMGQEKGTEHVLLLSKSLGKLYLLILTLG